MSTPRRYRLALLAYPAAYRRARQAELEATLAEAAAEHGGPTLRETIGLLRGGIAARLGRDGTQRGAGCLTLVAAAVALAAAFAPGRFWSLEDDRGMPIVSGPPPSMRILLISTAVVAMAVTIGIWRGRQLSPWRTGGVVGGLAWLSIAVGVLQHGSMWRDHLQVHGDSVQAALLTAALAMVLAPLVAGCVNRVSIRFRLVLVCALIACAALASALPILNPSVGIAAIAIAATVPLTVVAGGLATVSGGGALPNGSHDHNG